MTELTLEQKIELAKWMGIKGVGLECVKLGECPSIVAEWPDKMRHDFVSDYWARNEATRQHCQDTERE